MSLATKRTAVIVGLALVVVLGTFAAPVAASHADHGDDDDHRQDDQHRDDQEDDGNSSFVLEIDQNGPVSGFLRFDCVGTLIRHECDKDGGLDAGPASVTYDGNNSADYRNQTGGGGDSFTVTVGNQSGSVGFDCTTTPETVTNASACSAGGSPPSTEQSHI